jgi:5-methylcytosine-specific restriction endonuclease McrA
MEYRKRNGGGTGSFLDRKDSSKPYEMENIVVCCVRCNKAKNTHFTYEEWKELGTVIRKWRALALLQKEIESANN